MIHRIFMGTVVLASMAFGQYVMGPVAYDTTNGIFQSSGYYPTPLSESSNGKAAILGSSVKDGLEDLVVQYAGGRHHGSGSYTDANGTSVSTSNSTGDLIIVQNGVRVDSILSPYYIMSRVAPAPTSYPNEFTETNWFGGGVATLRRLNGKGTSGATECGIIAVSSTLKLYIYEVCWEGSGISSKILNEVALPEDIARADYSYEFVRPLAVIDTTATGSYIVAMGNPKSKVGTSNAVGRVDVFSINSKNMWSITRLNGTGITSDSPSGIMENLSDNMMFGTSVAGIGDIDGDGNNDLAVLARAQYESGKLYIMFLDADYKLIKYSVAGGTAAPWQENIYFYNSGSNSFSQTCTSMGADDIDNNGKKELYVACHTIANNMYGNLAVKQFTFDASGIIQTAKVIGIATTPSSYLMHTSYSDPLILRNSATSAGSIYLPVSLQSRGATTYVNMRSPIHSIDFSKNYAVVAGAPRDSVVNLDSVFYINKIVYGTSSITGYSIQTLSGSTNCESSKGLGLSCLAPTTAAGTWSSIEITATGTCDAYHACKLKDTLHIYAHPANANAPDLASRLPEHIVLPMNFATQDLGVLNKYIFIRNYTSIQGSIGFIGVFPSQAQSSVNGSLNAYNRFTLTSKANSTGIDTLSFIVTTLGQNMLDTVLVHVVDPAKLLIGKVPKTPGTDIVYNANTNAYIELPLTDENGNPYEYLPQTFPVISGVPSIVLVANYLQIRVPEEQDITVRYRHLGKEESRTIHLSPLSAPTAIHSIALNASYHVRSEARGLQINGIHGNFRVRVFSLGGQLREQIQSNSQGSTWLPLQHSGMHIIRIDSPQGSRIIKHLGAL